MQPIALAAVLAALAAAAHAQPGLPPELAALAAEKSSECAGLGGSPRVGPAFATPVDLTGDGTDDYIVDLAGIECANAWSAFCGSAGCPVSVWIAGPQGLAQKWGDYAQGWSLDPAGASLGVLVERHGGACPGSASGAETCRERLTFDGPPAAPPAPAAAAAAPPAPSPAADAVSLPAPVAEGWSLRRTADGTPVAVSAGPGAFSTISVFCLAGQPWLAASLDAPFGADTAQLEFGFSRGSASSTARREDGAGGALVIELADRPLVGLLAGRDSAARVSLDGADQGVLSLRGSTRAIGAAIEACAR